MVIGALIVIVTLAAVSKLAVIATLQTHVDDLLPALLITEARDRAANGSTTPLSSDRKRDRLGKFVQRTAGFNLKEYLTVPFHTTYAPGQFLVTAALLPHRGPYRDTLILGRSPSMFFGIIAPAILALAALRLGGAGAHWRALTAATIVAGSWELWLFSAQMESYAIGIAGFGVMCWLLAAAPTSPSRIALWREAVIVAALPWLQYQFLFLLPAYLAARLWQLIAAGHPRRRLIRLGIPVLVLSAMSASVLFVLFLHQRSGDGVNWNAGPGNEFLFQIDPGASWSGILRYAIGFFAANTWLSLSAMVSFVPEPHQAYVPANALVLGLTVIGLVRLSSLHDARHRSLLVFALVMAATWAALVVAGKVTLSPTRHMLMFLPAIGLYAAIGAEAVAVWSGRTAIVITAVVATIVIGFGSTYAGEVARRRGQFDEQRIYALVAETRPQLIVSYSCTNNLELMPRLTVPQLYESCGGGWTTRGEAPLDGPTRILFVSEWEGYTAAALRDAQQGFEEVTGRAGLGNDYLVTVLQAVPGTAPDEVSARTVNGSNGLYLTLLEQRQPSSR
jgi:hypothetical protein